MSAAGHVSICADVTKAEMQEFATFDMDCLGMLGMNKDFLASFQSDFLVPVKDMLSKRASAGFHHLKQLFLDAVLDKSCKTGRADVCSFDTFVATLEVSQTDVKPFRELVCLRAVAYDMKAARGTTPDECNNMIRSWMEHASNMQEYLAGSACTDGSPLKRAGLTDEELEQARTVTDALAAEGRKLVDEQLSSVNATFEKSLQAAEQFVSRCPDPSNQEGHFVRFLMQQKTSIDKAASLQQELQTQFEAQKEYVVRYKVQEKGLDEKKVARSDKVSAQMEAIVTTFALLAILQNPKVQAPGEKHTPGEPQRRPFEVEYGVLRSCSCAPCRRTEDFDDPWGSMRRFQGGCGGVHPSQEEAAQNGFLRLARGLPAHQGAGSNLRQ